MVDFDAHADRTTPGRWITFGLVVGLPLALFILLASGVIPDPTWQSPGGHFYSVTAVAFVAIGMAIFMAVSAVSLRDMRVLLLSIAYLSSSLVLLVHAIMTPGVLFGMNPWVGFGGDFGVLLASCFLALASMRWSGAFQRRVLNHAAGILWSAVGLLLAFVAFAMASSYWGFADRFSFLVEPPVPMAATALTYLMLWFSLFRYVQLYRKHRSPVIFGVLASVVLLIETVISMTNSDLWLASWWLHHVILFLAFVVVVAGIAVQYRRRSTLRGVLEGLLLRDSLHQVEREYTDAIIALIAAVEARDPYTHGHSANVARISEQIGRQLGLRGEALETLHLSALLHDIGKIGIADSVLLKPGNLTAAEFAAISEHPVRGEEIVGKIGSLRPCLPGIRSHHERMDGSGYPDGLLGEQIPLFARIIAVADSYDAMTSQRPYRGPMSAAQALAIIQREAGSKLDPHVVAALIEVMRPAADASSATEHSVLAAD